MAKRKKKQKEPTLGFMLFTAFSGVFLGTLAAVAMLLSKPVDSASGAAPSEDDHKIGDFSVGYQPGIALSSESAAFKSRMTRFRRKLPGPLTFNEGEVNYFLRQFESAASEGEETEASNLKLSSPNLKIADEKLILSSVVVINPDTDPFKLTVQTEIRFDVTESGPRLRMGSAHLNSLPIPGFVSSMLIGKLMGKASFPAELLDAWKAVKEITLEDGKFLITL